MERDNSIAGLIRQDLLSIAEHKEVFIKVPGYEKSGIQIKYRMPDDSKELNAIAVKVERETKDRFARNIRTIMDTMIALCDGVYCQPGTENPEPLDMEDTGMPCEIDDRLAGYLGMNGDGDITAREVLRRLFGNNDFAIIGHGEKLQRWLMDNNTDVNAEFWQSLMLGE